MYASLKIQRASGKIKEVYSMKELDFDFNHDGTATIEAVAYDPMGNEYHEFIIGEGDRAYSMSATGDTVTSFYPTPKRGQV